MGWTAFYLFVVLKIPVVMALWIVWWAVRSEPAPAAEEAPDGSDGWTHPRGPRPRPPRRGPHGAPLPASPARVRTAIARRGVGTR